MGSNAKWTQEQYDAYMKKMGATPAAIPAPVVITPEKKKPTMNKTEAEYLRILEARLRAGEIRAILPHESIKLRVGENRCVYSPDCPVIGNDGVLEFHEVKGGHVWDDARVKFQSAKQQYPHFRFVWAQKKSGTWTITA